MMWIIDNLSVEILVKSVCMDVEEYIKEYPSCDAIIRKIEGAKLLINNQYRLQKLQERRALERNSFWLDGLTNSETLKECIDLIYKLHSKIEQRLRDWKYIDNDYEKRISLQNSKRLEACVKWYTNESFDEYNDGFYVNTRTKSYALMMRNHPIPCPNTQDGENEDILSDSTDAFNGEDWIDNMTVLLRSAEAKTFEDIVIDIERVVNSIQTTLIGFLQDHKYITEVDPSDIKADNNIGYRDFISNRLQELKKTCFEDFKDEVQFKIEKKCERVRKNAFDLDQMELIEILSDLREDELGEIENYAEYSRLRSKLSRDDGNYLQELARELYHKENADDFLSHCIKVMLLDKQIEKVENGIKDAVIAEYRQFEAPINTIFVNELTSDKILLIKKAIEDEMIKHITTQKDWFFVWVVLNELELLKKKDKASFADQMNKEGWFIDNEVKCVEKPLSVYSRYFGAHKIEEWDEQKYQDGKSAGEKEDACRIYKMICQKFKSRLIYLGVVSPKD